MLDQLRDGPFAELEDAYGPAVDVPSQLRRLCDPDLDVAREALGNLNAGIFHQGSYFNSTAPAVPFLIEIAAAPLPIRAELLLFLADMLPERAPSVPSFDPYLFRSQPALPEYPEATSTIAAIQRGTSALEPALDAGDAEVRSAAAFLLSLTAGEQTIDRFARRLTIEDDENVRVALMFALASIGGSPALLSRGTVARVTLSGDVAAVLTANAPLGDGALEALGRLLLAPTASRTEIPFYGGVLARFATNTLERLAPDEPRAFSILDRALRARFERGEAIVELPHMPSPRIGDDETPPARDFASYDQAEPLRLLAGAMARIAFGERAIEARILRREELDDRRRRVLELTRDHGIALPLRCAPWITPVSMGRFLTGGSPMDEEVEIDGVRAPIYVHLVPTEHEPQERVDAIFVALARVVPREHIVELGADILAGGYTACCPYTWGNAVLAHFEPLAIAEPAKLRAFAETLLDAEFPSMAEARLALALDFRSGKPCDERFDRLARAAMSRVTDATRAWLAAFESPRRERIVASYGNPYLIHSYEALCDRERLEAALLDAFMAADCRWPVDDAATVLGRVSDLDRLIALRDRADARRRQALDLAIRARTRAGYFTLELVAGEATIAAELRDDTRVLLTLELSLSPMPEELEPLRPILRAVERPVIELEGTLDGTTEYRVQRLLAELALPIEVRSGGSSLRAG